MNSINYYYKNLATALLLALMLFGCNGDEHALIQVGAKAPPFTLKLVDGGQANLAQYAGKGLVITFMASWCPCSNDSMPLMKDAYQTHKDDIAFLMVGVQDAESKFGQYVKKWDVPFAAGFDDGDKIARAYGIGSPPTTYFIDKTGLVKRAFYGNIKDKPSEFQQWLKEIM
ncbi:MAG: TlpA disulfide reductase family protein [Mariprofundus sp.]|nr:TlpA disulfide reductase family protein [Mariprofundus sp.]